MKKYIFLFIIVCLTFSLNAQVDRSKAPSAGPAPKVHVGEYQKFTLSNGLIVLVVENSKLPKVNYSMYIIKDPQLEKNKTGLSDVAGELWGKATQDRTPKELHEEVDYIGAYLSTSSSSVSVGGLSRYDEQLMDILADVVLKPNFTQEELDKILLQYESAITTNQASPQYILSNITKATMYGMGHPYGEITTVSTLKNITLEDCKEYYNQFVMPNHAILVIVGDITLNKARELTEKHFSNWERGIHTSYKYNLPAQPKGKQIVFANKDAAVQSSIKVAYPINYKIGAPDARAASVMNFILGGGMQGKLFRNLRETKGYTYGAYSDMSTSYLDGAGSFSVNTEVRANVTDSAVIEIMKEMQDMTRGNFSHEDVERNKKVLAGYFSRSLESPSTIANFAYNTERYNLPKDYYTNYLTDLSRVSKEDVIIASKKYIHPENTYIFVVGDRSIKESLKPFSSDGTILELDAEGKPVAETPALSGDIKAEDVLNKYIDAIGGKDKINGVKDMTVTSEMDVQGMAITNIYKFIIDNENPYFLFESSMGGNSMQKVVFDGGKATLTGPMGSQTLEGDDIKDIKQQAYPIPELTYALQGIDVSLEGIEKVDGKDAYKIKFTLGDAITYSYYDMESGLKIKAVSSQNGMTQEVFLEDYRPVDGGYLYPFITKTTVQGMPFEVKVTDIKVNTGLTAEDFK
ncbi:MAG: insulinase family protein [Odoribacter sp.]|nr:insulinase family protein [Odoribacter sp.]